ncbi:MAG TPA: hypothetical protein V6C57_22955 [Coleofasciculaceae cyanobacterium]
MPFDRNQHLTGHQILIVLGIVVVAPAVLIVLLALLIPQHSPIATEPAPSTSTTSIPVPQEKPSPTTAQVWQIANTESCWNIVNSQYGFSSPKGEVVGIYAGMGYEDSKLDTMYDLTKVAAVKLLEGDRNVEAVKTAMTNEWLDGSDTAAAIVVRVANEVYLPKHLEIAAKECIE